MPLNATEILFFDLVREAFCIPTDAAAINLEPQQWDSLFALTKAQGLSAVVFDALSSHPNNMPFSLKMAWGALAIEIRGRYASQSEKLALLGEKFDERGVKVVLLKGIGLSLLYPKKENRECGDIDVLCLCDFDESCSIFGSAGFERGMVTPRHIHFCNGDVTVENHKGIVFDSKNAKEEKICKALESGFAERLNPLPYKGIWTADRTVDALYLMEHALSHLVWGELSFRAVLDLGLFIRKYGAEINWQYLAEMWKEAGVLRVASVIGSLCKKYFLPDLHLPGIFLDSSDADIEYVMSEILHPLTELQCNKVTKKVVRYFRKKKMYEFVYGCRFPDSVLKEFLPSKDRDSD